MFARVSHPSNGPADSVFHSRAPSSPAVSLHHLHIAVQQEDESLLPSNSEPHELAAAQSRPLHPSLSSYSSFESDGATLYGSQLQLHPVSVPSPLPSYPPSPSGTGSSTPTSFASLEQQKREIAHEQQAGRLPRHRHSILASLPPQQPDPPHEQVNTPLPAQPLVDIAHRRRELDHHQTVLSSHYCSSLLAARAADRAYPLLFCVLSRRIVSEGDNFLLYSYPSSCSVPLHLLALIHTFAIVNDAAEAVTAQSVRRVLLRGDASRQRREVLVSVQEEDDRLYVLALTGVGQSERRQWEVRIDSMLLTLRRVMCALYGQPHEHWFDPLLPSHQTHEEGGFDPSCPVAVPSVPASGGSFISSLLVLASSYYSLHLLDPLLRLFCQRVFSYPSPELAFTPICGLVAARSMEAREEEAWRAALTRLQADQTSADSLSPQHTSAAFAVDSILLFHHRTWLAPDLAQLSRSLSLQLLTTVTAILALNGWLDGPCLSVSHPCSSATSPAPSTPALRSRVFRMQLPRSLDPVQSSEDRSQAVLSAVGQSEWLVAALLLSPSRPSQPAPAVASLSTDPYHVEPLRALLAALSPQSSPLSHSASRSAASCYSFSVSPSPLIILHPGRQSLCPTLHTACYRLHSLLQPSSRLFQTDSCETVGHFNGGETGDNGNTALAALLLSRPLLHELAITARDEAGHCYSIKGRRRQPGIGAVLVCENTAEAAGEEWRQCDDDSACGTDGRSDCTSCVGDVMLARGWQLLLTLSPEHGNEK